MNSQYVSQVFSALAHPSRVEILMVLLRKTETGVPLGQLSAALNIPPSTLKHHVIEMEQAGVINCRNEGRKSIYKADTTRLNEVIHLLMDICCPPDTRMND